LEPYDPYPPVRSRRRPHRSDRFDDDRDDRFGLPFDVRDLAAEDGAPARRDRPPLDTGLPDEPAWSTWLGAVHGPEPLPSWVVTDLGAVDADLGVLKTGKEADVHLVERAVPGGASSLLAAKRYRGAQHRLFHRDAGYLEGRRVRRSRETRAMARRTDFGRDVIAVQWAAAEFDALSRLWTAGLDGSVRVPYPVQLLGTELMLEFIGDAGGVAAPRLARLHPTGAELAELWDQCVTAVLALAGLGLAHGDLSPYNALVHDGRLVLIDLPQIVDVVANPQGPTFLARDVATMTAWFTSRGVAADPQALTEDCLRVAGLR